MTILISEEDREIFRRNFKRLMQWCNDIPAADRFGRDLVAIANFCGDYMHRKPR